MKQQENWYYGLHTVEALLHNATAKIIKLYVAAGRKNPKIEQLIKQATQLQLNISYVNKDVLDDITDGGNHQGIAVFAQVLQIFNEDDLQAMVQNKQQPVLILLLDGIQDPHNLGAIFRTADAAAVDVIIAPKDNAVSITPTVSKVASGAVDRVPFIQVTNLVRTMQKLKDLGVWIYGADDAAEKNIYTEKFVGNIALVMGAEGKGIRRLTREHCDFLMHIPMLGEVSSLNVSVATGICLYEIVRQRLFKGS